MMKLDALNTLGHLCLPGHEARAQELAEELLELVRSRRVTPTPIVLVRLEEFLVLYHVVQGIEQDLRELGVRAPESANPTSDKKCQLHPNIEHAAKARERLNKSIKELEAVLKAEGSTGPTNFAELMSMLRDEHEREDANDDGS